VQICEGIIIPNVRFRDEDEDDFSSNYKEYLRRDLEGSDSETRRHAASDFVRCLTDKFPTSTTTIMTQYIMSLLAEYTADPAGKWVNKNCALYMVMALAVKGKTAASGATVINELVNIEQFFHEHVLPELLTDNVNERPVLKADCLRCVSPAPCAPVVVRACHLLSGTVSNI
jgi:exportin-2 (importin alpha re-exporter)